MSQQAHHEATQRAVKMKFRGKQEKVSKAVPHYPDSPEREYQRLMRAYLQVLNHTLKENLPAMMAVYKQYRSDDASTRLDSFDDVAFYLRQLTDKVRAIIEKALGRFNLEKKLREIGNSTKKHSVREWKRLVHKTLGVDIEEDYYNGEEYSHLLEEWVSENVQKVTSLPNDTLGKLEDIILQGYRNGDTIDTIRKQIQEAYDIDKAHAELLARDQIGDLNAQITKKEQQDAGVKKFEWSSSEDERVRPAHQEFDGQTYSWDDPPEDWYPTKSRGRVYTGHKYTPGQAPNCRCAALPVFDFGNIDLPIKGEAEVKTMTPWRMNNTSE